MKYTFILFILVSSLASAQINKNNIYGTWVKAKTTYLNGSELSDDNMLKYSYVKYTFKSPDLLSVALVYDEVGSGLNFEIDDDYLKLKSPEGFVMNQLKIVAIKDTLVLVQPGQQGFDDPFSVKYYFVHEAAYQAIIPLKPDDIYSIIAGDTTYKENPKVYAMYKDGRFQTAVYKGISDNISMDGRNAHFLAVFTVFKSGIADSLKIIEGIDDKFNKRFIKVFNQTKKNWSPAMLNGQDVPVEMKLELRYFSSEVILPVNNLTDNANEAYNNKQYDIALYLYDQSLDAIPSNKDNLYKRGICKMHLGNMSGACEDWNKIKALGSTPEGNAMLENIVSKTTL